jgi:hypothetical protein
MAPGTRAAIWSADSPVAVGTGLLIHESMVLVDGDLTEVLVDRPHVGMALIVRLDAPDGTRTECVPVARVHVVHEGGPYVSLELTTASELPVAAFPSAVLARRRAAVAARTPDPDGVAAIRLPDILDGDGLPNTSSVTTPLCLTHPFKPTCVRPK